MPTSQEWLYHKHIAKNSRESPGKYVAAAQQLLPGKTPRGVYYYCSLTCILVKAGKTPKNQAWRKRALLWPAQHTGKLGPEAVKARGVHLSFAGAGRPQWQRKPRAAQGRQGRACHRAGTARWPPGHCAGGPPSRHAGTAGARQHVRHGATYKALGGLF